MLPCTEGGGPEEMCTGCGDGALLCSLSLDTLGSYSNDNRIRAHEDYLSHLHCVSLLKDKNIDYSGRFLCCVWLGDRVKPLQWSSQWMSHKNKPCLKFGVTRVWLWGWRGRAGDEGQHWLAHFGHAWNQFSFSGIRILKTLQNMSEYTQTYLLYCRRFIISEALILKF